MPLRTRISCGPQQARLRHTVLRRNTRPISLIYKLPIDARVSAAADINFARMFDHLTIGPTQYAIPIAHACIEALEQAGVSDPAKRIFISDILIRT